MNLVFCKYIGKQYDSSSIYEFLFSEDELKSFELGWEEYNWDAQPSNGKPNSFAKTISEVAILTTDEISLSMLIDSSYFDMLDSRDGIVALAWENISESDDEDENTRIVLKYGLKKQDVIDIFYSRDIHLEFKQI
jgi:hypothetical protein